MIPTKPLWVGSWWLRWKWRDGGRCNYLPSRKHLPDWWKPGEQLTRPTPELHRGFWWSDLRKQPEVKCDLISCLRLDCSWIIRTNHSSPSTKVQRVLWLSDYIAVWFTLIYSRGWALTLASAHYLRTCTSRLPDTLWPPFGDKLLVVFSPVHLRLPYCAGGRAAAIVHVALHNRLMASIQICFPVCLFERRLFKEERNDGAGVNWRDTNAPGFLFKQTEDNVGSDDDDVILATLWPTLWPYDLINRLYREVSSEVTNVTSTVMTSDSRTRSRLVR